MRRLVALALLALVAGGCSKKKADAKPDHGGRQGLTFAVDVLQVEAKQVDYAVTAPGTVDAFEHVQVTARVAGAVDRVAFTEGQQIKKGDVLVVIDGERYQLGVNTAKAALDKAELQQKDSEGMVTRREGATDKHPGLVPGEEIESYRTKSATAKADTQSAVEALKLAQLNLRDSSVRAPMDGVIQTRTIETGQYVQPGYVMATLLRNDPMLLRFQVEPSEAPRLKPGMMATFTLRETQRQYSAKITLVAGAADATTHMVPVTAEIANDDHKFWMRPGSFCDVAISLNATRLAPLVPRLAARATDHGYVAYVIEGDIAKEHTLSLGMNTKDGWVEVRSGLAAGDLVVVRGGEALSEGAKVKANRVSADSLAGGADAGAPQPAASDSAAVRSASASASAAPSASAAVRQ